MSRFWMSRSPRSGSPRGFTLIELMIVVAVIAILTMVAVPSYNQYIVRTHRSAAQTEMMDIANRQQQTLLANRRYATKAELVATGYTLPTAVANRYTWDVAVGTGALPTYTITFTAIGGQLADGDLSLNQAGVKTPPEKW